MGKPINAGRGSRGTRTPPELPRRMLDLWPVLLVGTTGWLVAFIVLLVIGYDDVWLFTTLCGVLLGLIGVPLMLWQRAASRKGVRSAQRDL